MSRDIAKAETRDIATVTTSAPSTASKIMQRLFERFLAGMLTVELPSGECVQRKAEMPGPEAILKINSWRALRRLVTRGDIGFAEGYMEGDWTTPNLAALFEWAHVNEKALSPIWSGSKLERIIDRIRHLRRNNSKRGSRRNIADHYDLGNDFYSTWLDDGMSYSSALYTRPEMTLAEAQSAKLDRAIELLDPEPASRVLEIGCGWGALVERLIRTRNCQVKGITLSKEQMAWAAKRVRGVDPSGDSKIVLKDYRDERARYDRIVSIEMFEAAGEKYWPLFFENLRERLVSGGSAVLQVITIEKQRFEDYRRRPDFIQRYIFPGGMLPTVEHLGKLASDAGLALDHSEMFGDSYAKTLAAWRDRFARASPALSRRLADQRFCNMWEYYLAYCEVGFRHGALDVGLFRFRR